MSSANSQESSPTPAHSINEPQVNLSYDQIVDMLVHNKPVPGIVDIPDTVLGTEMASTPEAPRRLKPWETTQEE